MRFIVYAASLVFLLWGTPALAGPCVDSDGDMVCDITDNCVGPLPGGSSSANMMQADSDSDDCGNVCDPDYDQATKVDFGDVIAEIGYLVLPNDGLHDHTNTPNAIGVGPITFADVFVAINYLTNPGGPAPAGPSGTATGATPNICKPYP